MIAPFRFGDPNSDIRFLPLAADYDIPLSTAASLSARFPWLTPAGWFTGIPITGAGGGLVGTTCIMLVKYQDIAEVMPLHAYLPVFLFVLALGMISRIRFPKAKVRDNKLINGFQAVNVAATYYCGITRSYPEYLFFMALFLLVAGIIAGRISSREAREA